MTVQMFKEQLSGKYDGVAAPTLLPVGGISDGQNMRKVSAVGGWKPRKGCALHNTTTLGAFSVLSLHQYTHPRCGDYHFLVQANSNLYDASNDPPASGTTFGSSVSTLVGTTPGFSDVVGDYWEYADGSGAPVMWGGDGAYAEEVLFWDNSEVTYTSYTKDLTDGDSTTTAVVSIAASDKLYIASPCRASGIIFDLGGTVNAEVQAVTVKSWVAGAWADREETDGTAVGGASLAQDGSMTWAVNASDTMKVIQGKMAYWYELSWAGALTANVVINSVKIVFAMERMSNKWSGVYEQPLAVRFYDQSAANYLDLTGKLTNESTGMYFQLNDATTSDFLYVKSAEPLCGIGFGIDPSYPLTVDAQIDSVEYWDGDSWNALTTGLVDETYDGTDTSFSQSGTLWWNAAGLTVKRRTMSFDTQPGYWYRVSWDAALADTEDDARLYFVVVANYPETLGIYDGVVEFKDRTFLWGDKLYPNRLRHSAVARGDCFSGSDSGYTDAFGDKTKVVCAKRFYNELIVWKANSVYLLEGYTPANFGVLKITDTVGCCAPKTAKVIEVGYPSMHADEPLSIAIWMDVDGVYVLDGRKPRKVSDPVKQYFDTEYTTAIAAASLDDCQAFVDSLRNEYHLLINTTTELVYNYVLDEWYPPWVRNVGAAAAYLVTGLQVRGTDGRYYTYGGSTAGFVFKLESDTTDKNASNADVVIRHKLKTRAISADQKASTTLRFDFRKAFIEAKARTTPTTKTIVVNFYKDLATSATVLTAPEAIDLGNTGYSLVVDNVETFQENCNCFQLEFDANTADLELEIYSFLYELGARGELSV